MNRGWETPPPQTAGRGWRDDIGDFHYDVAFNFTKFDELWANNPSESLENKKNPYKRTTQQRGYAGVYYENMGFYKDANDVYNSVQRTGSHSLTAGDLKYYDFNGDGVIDGADQHRLGDAFYICVIQNFNNSYF